MTRCGTQDAIQTQAAVSALMEELATEKRKPTSPALTDNASLFVRLEDVQVPNIAGVPIVSICELTTNAAN